MANTVIPALYISKHTALPEKSPLAGLPDHLHQQIFRFNNPHTIATVNRESSLDSAPETAMTMHERIWQRYESSPNLKLYVDQANSAPLTATHKIHWVYNQAMKEAQTVNGSEVETVTIFEQLPHPELFPEKLSRLAQWATNEKARNLMVLFKEISKQCPEAEAFYSDISQEWKDRIIIWITDPAHRAEIIAMNCFGLQQIDLPDINLAQFSSETLDKVFQKMRRLSPAAQQYYDEHYPNMADEIRGWMGENQGPLQAIQGLDLYDLPISTLPAELDLLSELSAVSVNESQARNIPSTKIRDVIVGNKTLFFMGFLIGVISALLSVFLLLFYLWAILTGRAAEIEGKVRAWVNSKLY